MKIIQDKFEQKLERKATLAFKQKKIAKQNKFSPTKYRNVNLTELRG